MNILRNILIGAVSAAAVAAIATSASAQTSTGTGASADLTVSAKLITPLTISGVTGIDFGTAVTPSGGSKTIIMSPTGARSGTATLLASAAGSAGAFTIGGELGQVFTTTVTPTVPDGFTLVPALAGDTNCTFASGLPTTITTGTSCSVGVGGTLTVPTGFHGTVADSKLSITIAYN
ncbi:hypothetical protein DJ021_17240 [Phenylobacterium hankyongense]|uniref:DUF4402 domain-containing protein n=1 Tax=Phenylobacterium hankyongense TaxID=1813876 RepID=A0A328B1T6_9CAUL|nr:DUF4402 domain-containing protein [Phenylobacterium hankyongense]RAK61422.1 hypothetical protein DJ021_17240 [Phenylobacterium hankyongense]